jgi:hypothetical protein
MERFNAVMKRFGFDGVKLPDLSPIPYGSAKEYLKVLEEKYSTDSTAKPEPEGEEPEEKAEEGKNGKINR